ncbi:MAG TPA: GAF domain-containing protein [Clostridiales bacterium]|nr:GAF domain-containing protein [Clostridiales bacterium]
MMDKVNLCKMLEIGVALTKEKNYDKLLSLIISVSMDITSSDAGTLYMYEKNALHFKIMKNNTLGLNNGENGDVSEFPPVPLEEGNVCAYSAINRKIVNIPDVYNYDKFDFSGPRNYDPITGYRTKSMLVIPLENHENELIGVLQLINSLDCDGNVIPFNKEYEYVLMAIASQAAISVSNMKYNQEVKDLLHSIVSVFATAVDARTPYNSCHTSNVSKYVGILIDYINEKYSNGEIDIFFDENRREQLILATMLHDLGKLIIPLEIMNKETRLGAQLDTILNRFDHLISLWYIEFLESRISRDEWLTEKQFLTDAKQYVKDINTSICLSDDDVAYVNNLANKTYPNINGDTKFYITPQEKECLLIIKGTLTNDERYIMETHVDFTEKLLSKINMTENYKNISVWASSHHEYLDGTGYPKHLTAENIPFEARILAVADIYEALTAVDRPYKKSVSSDDALNVLFSMANEGKLDKYIVNLFNDAIKNRHFECEG